MGRRQNSLRRLCEQVKRRKGEDAEEFEEEERALSTIANLFQGLSRGSRRDRLAAKFVENEFEKCDRLLELYSRYHHRDRAAQVTYDSSRITWLGHNSLAILSPCTIFCPLLHLKRCNGNNRASMSMAPSTISSCSSTLSALH